MKAVKVLICGSRSWTDPRPIIARVNALPERTIVIHGDADGADKIARKAALDRKLFVVDVPVEDEHWDFFGKSAGPIRNGVMLDLDPDLVIAFQKGGSSGTQSTIDGARSRGIGVEVFAA